MLTRKGAEIPVRVLPVPGPDSGYALVFGDAEKRFDPLVRIHSRCLYGDTLQSDDCDCGSELDRAMDMIQGEGAGVLIYLEQEGRGAGLMVKALGLRLTQLSNIDTFAAYRELGYEGDLRLFGGAAELLRRELGMDSVRLLTNNPDKVVALRNAGIEVSPVALHTRPRSEWARKYLEAKRIQRGHDLLPRTVWVRGAWAKRTSLALLVASAGGASIWAEREIVVASQFLILTVFAASYPVRTSARFRTRALLRSTANRVAARYDRWCSENLDR
ncbi:GTP cyclohydrolase II [Nocardia inohanensis]|uniref:GTP cyclohydrolase II n=1 Tax=Nocardia inohanensis TaxID=209246 RepID=UPI00082AC345|nr:GTP cyclohydrolase II [Nocardia inohanensis]